jgi:hypothetical protein
MVFSVTAAAISYVGIERPLQRYRHSLKAREREVDAGREPADGGVVSLTQMLPQPRFAETRIRAMSER